MCAVKDSICAVAVSMWAVTGVVRDITIVLWAVAAPMWAVTVSMGDVAGAVWAVASPMWAVTAKCWMCNGVKQRQRKNLRSQIPTQCRRRKHKKILPGFSFLVIEKKNLPGFLF